MGLDPKKVEVAARTNQIRESSHITSHDESHDLQVSNILHGGSDRDMCGRGCGLVDLRGIHLSVCGGLHLEKEETEIKSESLSV